MNIMRNPRKIFKGVFNSRKTEMCKMKRTIKNITEPIINTTVGKTIKLDNRTIYPIIQTYVIRNEKQGVMMAEIFPIAWVVQEPDDAYIISLIDDTINPEDLIELIPSEKEHEKTVIALLKRCSK
jgi:uncharacterized spore protein YtfJ